jgi:hypothetical protein
MGKNQSASNLTNIIKQDASGNISFVSGSTTLMSVSSSGAIATTGNVAGTASYASNAELLDGLDSTVFTLTSSFAAQTASFTAFTSSVNTFTASLNSFSASILTFTASQNILNGTYATTGSNTFAGIQTVNSNLIVTGSITAQTLVVQTITSSVDFVTGSTRFGSILDNTHVFSGSVTMNPGGLFVSSSGLVGVGTTNPRFYTLHVVNSGSNAQIGVSNQGTADGDRQLRMGFGGNGANTWAELQGTRLNVADDVNIALQPGGGNISVGTGSIGASANGGTNFLVGGSGPAITIRDNSSGGHWSLMARTGGSTPLFRIWDVVNSADRLVINSSGSIGIGTPSPSTLVHINTARSSGANVDVITLSDNVTGVQTSGFGVRILATSNNGQAKSAIAFEADGGTNNDTAIAFYTQTSAAAMPQRLIIDKNGTVRVNTSISSTNYKFGVSGSAYINGTNNRGIFITDGASYASIVGLNNAISSYNSLELRASGVDGQLMLTSGGNIGFFTTNPSGSVSSNFVHINGASAALRVGPNYPAAGAGTDRDFLEILPGGSTTTILAPNEEFLLSNPGGGAGSWAINVIAGSGGVRLTNGATSWAAISDIRQKDIIEPITNALFKVSTLSTVIYKFKDDETEQRRVGLIAQEVNEILPEAVNSFEDEEKMWSVRYTEVIPLLTKAIQELKAENDTLKEILQRNNIQ